MSKVVQELRRFWRYSLTFPPRDKTPFGWFLYVFIWIWAIAGIVPGVLTAAFVIGHFHITDEGRLNALSVGFAFVSMIVIQFAAYALSGPISGLFPKYQETLREEGYVWKSFMVPGCLLGLIFLTGPFLVAIGTAYWYFVNPSIMPNVAATGAAGALVLKVLLILYNSVIAPGLKAIFLNVLWQWLHGDKAKTRGA
jgi:hypothetical protein